MPTKITKIVSKNGDDFILAFQDEQFPNGTVLDAPIGFRAVVTKVYKFNWWRKLLFRWGFNVKSMKMVRLDESSPINIKLMGERKGGFYWIKRSKDREWEVARFYPEGFCDDRVNQWFCEGNIYEESEIWSVKEFRILSPDEE